MAAGLLGSALAGGAQAAQDNAKTRIKQMHDEGITRMRQQFQTSERKAGQEYQSGRDERQQGYTQENAQMGHELSMEQEQYRQGQQNSRAAMSRQQKPQWQLVPTEDGGYVQYDPVSNTTRDANLPDGVNMGGGQLSDREKYQLDGIADRMESIRSAANDEMRSLTTEEKAELGRLQGQYDAALGTGDSMTPLQRLLAGEEGGEQSAQQQGGQQQEGGRQPAPDPSSIEGQTRQRQNEQRNTQEANKARREASQARDAADAVLERIERERGGGASRGGLLSQVNEAAGRGEVSQEAMAEAQQIADQILSLDQNQNISDDDRRWLSERLMRLQEAGVPLDLER